MNKLIRVLAWLLVCAVLSAISVYLYIFRQQIIEVVYIPNEFSYCGKMISGNDSEYKEIKSWLTTNKYDWFLSFSSYVPKQIYRHPTFVVNVMQGGVAVSYKTDDGYPQYYKSIDHSLEFSCIESSSQYVETRYGQKDGLHWRC